MSGAGGADIHTQHLNVTPTLTELFEQHTGLPSYKFPHYLEAYERHLGRFRDQAIVLLEIGVFRGGSLQVWRKAFPKAKIVGVDITPPARLADLEREGILFFQGSQTDAAFLKGVVEKVGPPSIVIDDASHWPHHQIAGLKTLLPLMTSDGVYCVEDTCMGYYWLVRGGPIHWFNRFMARKVRELNGHHHSPSVFTVTTRSIHHYDSLVIIERGTHVKPETRIYGTPEKSPTA